VRLFMIISHVKIIAFQLSLFCKNYRFSKTVLYIINRKIHGCLEIPDLFLVLNISQSFAALTRWISCSTLEINLVFPRTHVLFSIYYMAFQNSLFWLVDKWSVKTHIRTVVCIFRIWTGVPDVVYLAGNFCFANRKHFCFLIFQLCVKIYR
jgi:hypothetical protein